MEEAGRSRPRDVILELTAYAARLPVRIGFTVLGAGVVVGRRLIDVLSGVLCLGADAAPPRHDAGKVHERARAAQEAARASGLLSRPRR